MNNLVFQINFFQDHTKIIICPKMEAVSYIDENRNFRTYKLSAIEEHGCTRELFVRLKYAKTMVERLQKKLVEEREKDAWSIFSCYIRAVCVWMDAHGWNILFIIGAYTSHFLRNYVRKCYFN